MPPCFRESIDLARKIWGCWMSERVPGPPLNSGHRRQATIKHSRITPSKPASSSPYSSLYRNSSSQSHASSLTSVSICPSVGPNRKRYCHERDLYPFYTKPRRDPPITKEQLMPPRRRLEVEPETVWTHPSSKNSRIGTPPPGQPQWWPDEHITPSCVESTASGIWYEREGKRDFLSFKKMVPSFDGSHLSYRPFDDPIYRSPTPSFGNAVEKAEARRKKAEEAKRRGPAYEPDDQYPPPSDPMAFYSKIVPIEKPSLEKWRQSLKRRKLEHPAGSKLQTDDTGLRKYQAEPVMPVPDTEPWTWQPAGLARWPKWALKRRAEAVAKLSIGRERSPFWARKRKRGDGEDD